MTGEDSVTAVPDVREQLRGLAGRGVRWPVGRWPEAVLRPAAVLVLFGVLDHLPAEHASRAVPGDLDVLLVGRSPALAHHPGQVAFPGGRVDDDDPSPEAAAVREAVEETGLDPTGVEVLGSLATVPVPVSRHLVTPVLAWWHEPSAVGVVDRGESAHVFRTPVADLVDPAQRRTVVVEVAGGRRRTPAFLAGDHVVWGFTAMVLDTVLDALGWAEPWDRTREIPVPR
ncbi:NUDIX hydrolase [Actinotalea ferrariae CF5-4]|uniref:NUDIX hydrolase n=1 Tax=Actinotalea ferrariae CF5-4 TaxID=948458 RepID=A0A021VPG1_9CELL|nr:CoA pyrophosphatase [Actinotalea ferrariae]EYR63074.1 NUDIX hydrolase [Actinotalea ferrariae CF5-4]